MGSGLAQHAVRQTGQLGHGQRPARRLFDQLAAQRAPAHLFAHPAFEEGLGRLPQIQLRIELPAEALDIEQGFLQHHQLWLDFDVEAARHLEQAQQGAAELDLFQRLVEDGFADGADRCFELIHPRSARHPAGVDVRLGDALVVALEEGEEVLRQVVLVDVGQRAHDAEVERDVLTVRCDENVARMHVGVKEAVAEHLGEEDFDAGARQRGHVHALGAQGIDLRDRQAVHALHHHRAGTAVVPVDLGHREQWRIAEIAAQLRTVRRLAHQVQFVAEVLGKLGHHLARLQPAPFRPHAFEQRGSGFHQCDVVGDDVFDARPQHLDRHVLAGRQHREMHLRDRGRRHRLRLETAENLRQRLAVEGFQAGDRLFRREGRHAVLQLGQFVGQIGRQQIASRRQHLAELDEDGAERLQRLAQTHRTRRVEAAAEPGDTQQAGEAQLAAGVDQHLVQPETQADGDDLEQSQPAHRFSPSPRAADRQGSDGRRETSCCSIRQRRGSAHCTRRPAAPEAARGGPPRARVILRGLQMLLRFAPPFHS